MFYKINVKFYQKYTREFFIAILNIYNKIDKVSLNFSQNYFFLKAMV